MCLTINVICYLNFVSSIIGETKILLFSKSTIGGKIFWKSIKVTNTKVVEGSQGPISYHWILNPSNFQYCRKSNWSRCKRGWGKVFSFWGRVRVLDFFVPNEFPNCSSLYPISFTLSSTLVTYISNQKEEIITYLIWVYPKLDWFSMSWANQRCL